MTAVKSVRVMYEQKVCSAVRLQPPYETSTKTQEDRCPHTAASHIWLYRTGPSFPPQIRQMGVERGRDHITKKNTMLHIDFRISK